MGNSGKYCDLETKYGVVPIWVGRPIGLDNEPTESYEAAVVGQPEVGGKTIAHAEAFAATGREAVDLLKEVVEKLIETEKPVQLHAAGGSLR